jgi:hypothetical protein
MELTDKNAAEKIEGCQHQRRDDLDEHGAQLGYEDVFIKVDMCRKSRQQRPPHAALDRFPRLSRTSRSFARKQVAGADRSRFSLNIG